MLKHETTSSVQPNRKLVTQYKKEKKLQSLEKNGLWREQIYSFNQKGNIIKQNKTRNQNRLNTNHITKMFAVTLKVKITNAILS